MFSNARLPRSVRTPIASLLVASSLCACDGDGYDDGMQQPLPDTTAPAVAVGAASATFGIVTLNATASDDRGVTQVEFFVDGASVGIDSTAPYSLSWNSASVADGSHSITARASDAAGNATTSTAASIDVRNALTLDVVLAGSEEWPVATPSTATGEATLSVNLATGTISGSLGVDGMIATAAHIHDGHAGQNGPILVGLTMNATSDRWEIPAGTTLSSAQVAELLRGGLYLNAHSPAHPNGEIRGQILPETIDVLFAPLADSQTVVPVQSRGSGRGALTYDRAARTVVAHVAINGLGTVRAVQLRRGLAGTAGPVELTLTQDSADPTHWFADPGNLTQTALDALAAGGLYLAVETDAHPEGELRGQLAPPDIVVGFAELQGLQEVPDVATTATGTGAVTVNRTTGLATIHVTTRDLADASMAHLHQGYGGRNGPILIGLTQDGSNPAHWSAVDQPLPAAALDALAAGGTYLNAHTPAHPGGEIRGQVLTPGVLFIAGRLSGAEEVPARATDAAGTYALTILRAARTLELHANTRGLDDAVAAHLHQAYAGTNGPIEVGLEPDAASATHWSASGVQIDEQQLAAIERGATYVNVHSPEFPGGEIRGQVVPDDVRLVFTSMSGAEEVPAVPIDASGMVATTVGLATRLVTVHARTSGVDDAIAAHVHRAPRGTNGPVLLPLEPETGNPRHWFTVEQSVSEADIADFLAAQWYVNVHTPAYQDGAIRGQIGLAPLPPPDLTTPTVALAALPPTVSGTVTLAATANDDVGVVGVRFYVGGNLIGSDETAPYTLDWNTTAVSNGAATLTADARDAAGNVGQSAAIVVIVDNVVPPPDTTAPTVTLAAPGGPLSGTVTLSADAQDAVGVVMVRFFVNGAEIGSDAAAPYSIEWDTRTVANGQVNLTADARDAAGNVGQSVVVVTTVANVSPTTLSQLQASIFTPRCSGCHTGGGGGLPSSLNLSSTAASHAALVNVLSIQQPARPRVVPNDADESYLFRKLQGGPAIDGDRMPFGGPFLTAAEMAMVRSWIESGAPNN